MRPVYLFALLALLLFVPSLAGAQPGTAEARVAAVIFACSRPSHLRKTLRSLAEQDPTARKQVDLYVSIDAHRRAKHVHRAAEAEALALGVYLSGIWRQTPPEPDALDVRARISRHYYLGLSRLFSISPPPSHAIVLEDDLELSPDFLSFLLAFAPYTSVDPSSGPAAISGWNDNGASYSAPGAADTHLTSLFPGLGWLLPRSVWVEIEPYWPYRSAPDNASPGSDTKRKFPPSSVAPAGWDWWLRAEFQAREWSTLYPLLGRVAHRGAAGANVAPGQQQTAFAQTCTADQRQAVSLEAWTHTARQAGTVSGQDFRAWLDQHENLSAPVNALSELRPEAMSPGKGGLSQGSGKWYSLRFQERDFPSIARRLQLWPHPRGFFEGRLALPLKGGDMLLLMRNAVRSRHAEHLKPFLAGVNVSCADACSGSGDQLCLEQAITQLNFCGAMSKMFECKNGCVFETGEDIPAIVNRGAPLETRGMCVVTEDAASISCQGRFQHTRRVCVCNQVGSIKGERRQSIWPVQSSANDLNGRNKEEL